MQWWENDAVVRFGDTFSSASMSGNASYAAVLFESLEPDGLLGDTNLDAIVNGLDVNPFVARLTTSTCQVGGDNNEDGEVNGLEVNPPVEMLTGGLAAVPEPATPTLIAAAAGMPGVARRVS
jgi:hypothetical protein